MIVTSSARVNPVLLHPREQRASLDGEWRFRLDPDSKGLDEAWFDNSERIATPIRVPGCWQGQGFGHDGCDQVWDFRLEARVFRATYKGPGWYAKTFGLPKNWRDKRIRLNFGGAHPTAEVWLNGERCGENHLPLAPFGFDVTDVLRHGEDNELVVRVSEEDRLFGLAYSWQGNWSGLYRGVDLTASGPRRIEDLHLLPDVNKESLEVRAWIDGRGRSEKGLALHLRVATWQDNRTVVEQVLPVARSARTPTLQCGNDASGTGRMEGWRPRRPQCLPGGELRGEVGVPSPLPWSPDAPNLYRVDVELRCGRQVFDARSERVGFVDLAQKDKHFRINSKPYYLRGTGEFMPYPETGSPDTDHERWRRKLRTLRDYGYNQVRCQSYAPPPEYLDIADEVGLLVQSEMGMLGAWGSNTPDHIYAWPQPSPMYNARLREQWNAVVRRDVNHPSANMYCMSNELYLDTHYPRTARRCYRETKAIKPSAQVMWTDGGYNPDLPGDVVNDVSDRLIGDGHTDCGKPVIEHEYKWWSSYPDVLAMHKYSGAVRPYGAELALKAAAKYGMTDLLPAAAANSQRLQAIEAKGKLESLRRDKGAVIAGVSHFSAVDANLSPQGIIDEFFESKVTSAEQWQRANGDTAILCGMDFDDRVLSSGESRTVDFFVSDYAHPTLKHPVLKWSLRTREGAVARGRLVWPHDPYGTVRVGAAAFAAPSVRTPRPMLLRAEIRDGKRRIVNEWTLWVFPKSMALPAGVARYGTARHTWLTGYKSLPAVLAGQTTGRARPRLILSEKLDAALLRYMDKGGRVLLAASEGLVRPMNPKLGLTVGRYFFTPPANYGPYEDGHDGSLILDHAMLGRFPHEGFADLQCYRMMAESPPMELEAFDLHRDDVVWRPFHSYSICRPLGYLLERRIGRGGLILSALDLNREWPEARYLLRAFCRYAVGRRFSPRSALGGTALTRLASETSL